MEADKKGVSDALEDKLTVIECHLCDIRTDVSWILTAVRDELEAIRQRDFWQDHRR